MYSQFVVGCYLSENFIAHIVILLSDIMKSKLLVITIHYLPGYIHALFYIWLEMLTVSRQFSVSFMSFVAEINEGTLLRQII